MFMESFAQLSVPFQGFEFAVDAVQGIDQQGSAEKMDAANVQPVWVTADADPMFIRQVDPKDIPGFFQMSGPGIRTASIDFRCIVMPLHR